MMDYKIILSGSAVVIGIIGYIPYFADIFKKTTKPHFFSWFLWALLTGIAFAAQIADGAGVGAWVTGVTTILTLAIALLALKYGEKNVTRLDWACLAAGLLGILFWVLTDNPMWAVIIVTIVDLIAFIPTFRKGYEKPHEETITEYVTATIKFVIAIIALESYSITTWLYPASLVVTNAAFAIMAVIRRKQLKLKLV